jgi:hypothetical protein
MNFFDASAAPETEPTRFVAGDLVMWRRTDLADYTGAGFTLTYTLRPAAGGESEVTATGTVVNGEFRISLSSAVTAPMQPGRWYWSAYLTRTSDNQRVQIDDGEMTVEANRAVDPSDTRSHAQRTLDAIMAVIEGRATEDVQSYTIGGRQINKMGPDDLIRWKNHYRQEVEAERNAARRRNGLPSRNTLTVRFTG